MIDYHLHLWAHGKRDIGPTIEDLAAYLEQAKSHGVVEIAITEHLFRFVQTDKILGSYFRRYPESAMRSYMENYWKDHARADLDHYVEVALAAKDAGLNVVVGMEVDYYEGEMDKVTELLSGYPFDVLLGSIHWVQDWPFDHTESSLVQDHWDVIGIEGAWQGYTAALEELAETKAVDVLAHPDLIKIMGKFPRVPEEFYDRMAEAARKSAIAAEVSSAGFRKPIGEEYPAPYLLSKFKEYGVEITTASDAHNLGDVSKDFDRIRRIALAAGYESVNGFRARKANPILISQQ